VSLCRSGPGRYRWSMVAVRGGSVRRRPASKP